MAFLVVVRGADVGTELELEHDLLIGRHGGCGLVLGYPEVSSRHARVSCVGDRCFVEDLESRNGTFLNGARVVHQPLSDGDEIRIGRTVLRFHDAHGSPGKPFRRTETDESAAPAVSPVQDPARLSDLTSRLASVAGMKATLDTVAACLLDLFPRVERVTILLGEAPVALHPAAVRWRGAPRFPGDLCSESLVRRAVAEQRTVMINDGPCRKADALTTSLAERAVHAAMCAPITYHHELLGAVELLSLSATGRFDHEDTALLTSVTSMIALAVATARFEDERNRLADAAARAFITALRFRYPRLHAHGERVATASINIGKRLGMTADALETLGRAALLHDIGYLTLHPVDHAGADIAQDIQAATDPESEDDPRHRLLAHPERGAHVLTPIPSLNPVAKVVLAHHEYLDGSGYPRGIAGDRVPFLARIVAVADHFDTLTSGLVQPSRTHGDALHYLGRLAGDRLDPEVVHAFESVWHARERRDARHQDRPPGGDTPPNDTALP